MKKILLILFFMVAITTSYTHATNTNAKSLMCDEYDFTYEDYGCGNIKFTKNCGVTTTWNWGDGSPLETSSAMSVMHRFCKSGKYIVSITHPTNPNQILYHLEIEVQVDAELFASSLIISQSDCDESIVQFTGYANCIEEYDLNGMLVTGSDQLEWDFGDGTTSLASNPIHTYTIGGSYLVTLRAKNSSCDFKKTILLVLNDPVTCCLDKIVFDYNDKLEVGDAMTITGTKKVRNEIRIFDGGELILDKARIEMGEGAKIIVERGGVLKIINSVITTTICGGYVWEGIEVWGSGDDHDQYNFPGNGINGYLYVIGSTIEHADEAISVTKKLNTGFYAIDKNYNGGYIEVMKSYFKNNYTSINLWPYKHCVLTVSYDPCEDCNNFRNRNVISGNTFICNAQMRDPEYVAYLDESNNNTIPIGLSHFIYMNDSYNIQLINNDFINTYIVPPVSYRGIGVRAINSDFEVKQDVRTKGFRGLTRGIQASSNNAPCRNTTIINNKFMNCQVSIDVNSSKTTIRNNYIVIPTTAINSTIETQGVHTRNCTNFEISANSVQGASVGSKYGVLSRSNKTGFINENSFSNLFVGSQFELNNSAVGINCNLFSNQNYSITIPNGSLGTQGSLTKQAGNIFMDPCKSTSSNFNHIKSAINLNYYYNTLNTNEKPVCKTNNVNLIPANTQRSTCSIKAPNPCNPDCTKQDYIELISNARQNEDFEEVERLEAEMAIVLLEMDNGYYSYMDYLSSSSLSTKNAMMLIGTYFVEGNMNRVNDILNSLSADPNDENIGLVSLYQLLVNAYNDGRELDELNESEILELESYIEIDNNLAASYIAEGLLYQLYDKPIEHNPEAFNLSRAMNVGNESSVEEKVKLYPNPANHNIEISTDNLIINKVQIINLLGKLVVEYGSEASYYNIDITNLPSGIYNIKLFIDNSILNRKLIIE